MEADLTFRSDQRLTQDEFFEWLQRRPGNDAHHYELIHGRIVMSPPADFLHGSIGARLVHRISEHVRRHGLGRVLDASTGYDLPSGDTVEPDVSFVSNERLAAGPAPRRGRFAPFAPDLAVEILSRSTARRDRTVKREIYSASGVREYWIVDPERRQVTVYRRDATGYDRGTVVSSGAVASEVLGDLSLPLDEIFDT